MAEVLKDIEELKLGVKYRLVDKEGWLKEHPYNYKVLSKLPFIVKYFILDRINDVKNIGVVSDGEIYFNVIDYCEMGYFKEVHEVDDTEDIKEDKTSFKVGDYACIAKPNHTTDYNRELYKIVFISEDKNDYVVEDDNKILKVVGKVYSSYLSTKELKLKDMIAYYKTQSLDFANSDKDTMITLEMAAEYIAEVEY